MKVLLLPLVLLFLLATVPVGATFHAQKQKVKLVRDTNLNREMEQRYVSGDGVEKDLKEAAKWYRKSAEQGNGSAQYQLALCYYKFEGVIQNYQKAYTWFALALVNGVEDARKQMNVLKEKMTPSEIKEALSIAEEYNKGNFLYE